MDNSSSNPSITSENNATSNVSVRKKREYAKRANAWNHYTEFYDSSAKKHAKCNYCGKALSLQAKNCGTSPLNNHLVACPVFSKESSGQSKLAFGGSSVDEESKESKATLFAWKFDQKACRRAIVEMIIIDELPFKFVENAGFRNCMKIVQPLLVVPSRSTITRDCYDMYLYQKANLKAQIRKDVLRICLTTDTWTSIQRINYMCLTAHYIDCNWKLKKKIINFCPISSHKGRDIGRAVELCLLDWGFQNVFTVTVDNASSNDTAMEYLKGKFAKWGNLCVLNAKWSHVRCMAHVLNLVVQDGIKELSGSVDSVRAAVRYVRQSPNRLRNFMDYAKLENIDTKKSLCLDVPTRWNSTYLMLSVAILYERAFDRLATEDYAYNSDLLMNDGPGAPSSLDWENMKRLIGFLRHFYELTLRVSGTKYVTSSDYVDSISCIHSVLKECSASTDVGLKEMGDIMKKKFDKYWGKLEKFNLLVFIASAFDPRAKFDYLEVLLSSMYGEVVGGKVFDLCKNLMNDLFVDYKRMHFDQSSNSDDSTPVVSQPTSLGDSCLFSGDGDAIKTLREKNMAEVKRRKAESGIGNLKKTELDRYLTEEIEEDVNYFASCEFTVLGWWKKRSPTFPILSCIARDVLAIPISTVASESSFSTGGRVLDSFRSSLTPKMVQALICCQDWIRQSDVPVSVEEHLEDLEKIEDDIRQSKDDTTIVDV